MFKTDKQKRLDAERAYYEEEYRMLCEGADPDARDDTYDMGEDEAFWRAECDAKCNVPVMPPEYI